MTLMELFRKTWPFGGELEMPREDDRISVENAAAGDFIEEYADYADILEVPRAMHSMVATQIVASILNRNGVTIPLGAFMASLDLWVVLLSGSGHGRSTLVNLASPILEGAGVGDLVRGAEWGSEPAFMQDMADHPSGLFVWGELSQKLKQMNDPRFGGVKQWITDAYDNPKVPDERRYRKTNKSSDTPTITFTAAPRTNILATSSEDWFFENLRQEDSAGGFIPRWLIVRSDGPTKDIAIPQVPDSTKTGKLSRQLRTIAALRGVADIEAITAQYEKWYSETRRRFETQPNPGLAEAYFNRHRVHVLKLAVIYEAAASYQLRVSEASWDRAVVTARDLENTIFSLLETGMNALGFGLKKMEDFIRDRGTDGVTKSDFTRAFQTMQAWSRNAGIRTLIESGAIEPEERNTGGRPVTIYTHRNYRIRREVPRIAPRLLSS